MGRGPRRGGLRVQRHLVCSLSSSWSGRRRGATVSDCSVRRPSNYQKLSGLQSNGGKASASCTIRANCFQIRANCFKIRANCFQIRANYKLQGKASDRSGLWSACLAARACEGLSRTSNCGIRFGTAKRATRGCSPDGLVAPGSVEQRHTTAREEERERVKSFTSIYNKTYSLSHTSDGSRHIYLSSLALVDGAVTFGHCLHIFRHGREDVLAFPPF